MKRIFKCVMDARIVRAKGVGQILHLDVQGNDICFWYIYNPTAPDRTLTLIGTGHEFDGTYHGTVLCDPFVWHLVEI